jgi:hypothetical protein
MPSTGQAQPSHPATRREACPATHPATHPATRYEQALSILLLIGLVGTYYKTTGATCSWILIALLLFQFKQLDIGRRVLVNSLALLAALALGSLLSVNPPIALEGCGRILLSMLFFIPGVYLGRQLSRRPLLARSILPVTALYASHFFFIRNHGDIRFYGLSDNPNTVGQGLVYGLLLLLVLSAAETTHWRASKTGLHGFTRLTTLRLALIGATALMGTYLLISANCRQGWLAMAAAAFTLCMLQQSISKRAKLLTTVVIGLLLAALVYLKDQKGFGYGSVGERMDLWSHSLQAWLNHFPLFGAGLGSFEQMAEYHHYGNVTMTYWNPHNIAVELLFTGGIWGLICLVAYLVAMKNEYFPGSNSQPLNAIGLASIAALIGLLTLGMLDMGLTSTRYMGSIAAVAGILYAQAKPARSTPPGDTIHA